MIRNTLSSLAIAVAVWVSMIPLGTLLTQEFAHLGELGLLAAVFGLTGAIGALIGAGVFGTYALQTLAGLAIVIWRGFALAPPGDDWVARFQALLQEGSDTVSGAQPPLEPVAGLLWLMLVLTLVVLLITELLVNVLEQPLWAFAPLFLAFIISAIISPAEMPLWMFAAIAAGYVLVLVIGTGIGEGHRTASASKVGGFHAARVLLAALLAAGGIAGAAALQPMMPMAEKFLWRNSDGGPIQLGDPTITLNENLHRPDDVPVFNYRTSTGEGVYMRTVALPDLTKDGVRLVSMQLSTYGLGAAYDAPGRELSVDVTMDETPSEYLPVPFAIENYDADGLWSYDPETLTVVATGADRTEQTVGLEYSATSTVPSPSKDEVAAAQPGTDVSEINSIVPDVDEGVTALTKEVVGDAATAGEKALLIQDFLRSEEFEYSIEAPETPTLDVISTFLLEDRTGYCIHYASAMMTMARIEGIPSRMAIGFNTGTQQADGSYQVTAHNMHAWPELYFADLGWVPFEPTPSVASPPGYADSASEDAPPTPEPSPSPEDASPSPEPSGADASPSPSPSEEAPDEVDPDGTSAAPIMPSWLLPVIGGLLGLVALAALPYGIRRLQLWSRLRAGQEPAAQTAGALREIKASFVDSGRSWPAGSPGPAAEKAAESLDEDELLLSVADTLQRSTFARDGADTSSLPEQVRLLRSQLMAGTKWWQRFWPRSLWKA